MSGISAIRSWEVGAAAGRPMQIVTQKPFATIRRRTSIKFIALCLAVLFLLVAKIYIKAMIIGEGYKIEEIRKVALAKDTELRALRLQYASVSRPDVLSQRARTLGLRPALPQQLRRITP